jgi:hypothetical protein
MTVSEIMEIHFILTGLIVRKDLTEFRCRECYQFTRYPARLLVLSALGYGLDERGSRVRFPAGAGNFCLHQRVQNGSGAHPSSYPVGTGGSFLGDKAAEA